MIHTPRSLAILLGLVLVLLVAPVARAENSWSIIKVNIPIDGSTPTSDTYVDDVGRTVSADGRYVVLDNYCDRLFPRVCATMQFQVAIRDTWLGQTVLISATPTGGFGNDSSEKATITPDGRFVLFRSSATNLVADDTNGQVDIFLRDLQTGTTELVSKTDAEGPANAGSYSAAASTDARYVVFQSFASNLVAGDTNAKVDVFVRDRTLGTTTRVSIHSDGTQANNNSSYCAISGDGGTVAFVSTATNLVAGDVNGLSDLFVHNMGTRETTRASVSWNGAMELGNDVVSGWGLSLSEDGRYLAFSSDMSNLVPSDTNLVQDVFVRDLVASLTTRVSVSTAGSQADRRSYHASISREGRLVAFSSFATNLVSGATATTFQVYVRDLLAGTTSLITRAPTGAWGDGPSLYPSMSSDGRFIAFTSRASNLLLPLVDGYTQDVYLYDGGAATGGVTPLALDEVRTGRLSPGGLQLYSLDIETPHKVLVVRVAPQENVTALELATRFNVAPLVGRYDERTRTLNADGVYEIITGPSAMGTYMLRVMATDVSEPFGIYTIEAHLVDYYVSAVSPLAAGNAGLTTMNVQGANLDQVLAVSLRDTGGTLPALEAVPASPTELWARFDLTGVAPGEYEVVIDFLGGGQVVYGQPFVVTAGTGGLLESRIVGPAAVRGHTIYTFAVEYTNVGDADLPAPLFNVTITEGSEMRLRSREDWVVAGSIQVLGVNPNEPAGILPPGATGRVTMLFQVLDIGSELSIDLEVMERTSEPVYWDDYWAQLRPETYTEEEWLTVWPAVQAGLGDTWEEYTSRLGRAATRLRPRGGDPSDVRQLIGLEIMAASGEPVAAISGRLVDADTAVPLVGRQVIARQQEGLIVRSETSDLGGLFSIPYLAEGIYELHVDGYVVTPTLNVNVSAGTDAHGVLLLATPNPVEPELPPEREQYASPQLLEVEGTPHMVFSVEGQMYHTTFASGSWATAQPIPGALGTEPRLVYAPDLLDGTTPGLALFWRTGTGNEAAIAYAAARPDGAGGWEWSTAAIYNDDPTAASTQPAAVLDANGEPIVVWQMIDYDNANADRDLYYDHGPVQSLDLSWDEILALAQLDAPVTAPDGTLVPAGAIVALTEGGEAIVLAMTPEEWQHNFGFEWAFEKKGMVPAYIPIIGGNNIVQFKASLLGWYDSKEARATAGVGGEVSVMKNRVKGSVGGQFEAHWVLDKQACVFNLDKATLQTSLGLQGRFPVPQLTWGVEDIFKVEFGVQVDGTLQGSLIWIAQGGLMPYGEVTGLIGLGLYGQIEAIGLVEGSAAGTGNVRADITRDGFTFRDMYLQFKGEVRVGVIKYETTYRYPEEPEGAPVAGATLGDALAVLLTQDMAITTTVTLAELPGTTTVYAPAPVLSTIAADVVDDGPPALALGSDSLAYLFWHRETSDPTVTLGNTLAYATYDGTHWSVPTTLVGTRGFGREVAAVRDADGDLLVAWVQADEGDWTLASDPSAVSDAYKVADVRYALLSPGGSWSAPVDLTGPTGNYMFLQLSPVAGGGVWATWVQMDTASPTLFAALWNGTSWTAPVAVAQGSVQGAAPVLTVAGAPAAVWAQRTDDPALNLSESAALYTSAYDGAAWSTPVTLTVAYSPPVTPAAEGVFAQAAGGFLDLPVAIPEEWCTPPVPGEEDPPGGVDPGSEPIELPDPPEEYIDWTDHEEWVVVYSGDPNEKLGPLGYAAQRWIDGESPLSYSIFFENIPSATAPAQVVLITDTLDVDLDWTTFTVTEVAYGDRILPVMDGAGGAYLLDEIPDYRPGITKTWWVETIVSVDHGTGVLTAILTTLDPDTGQPPVDALAGFLPPNDSTGRGQGRLSFTVEADAGLADLTLIQNAAEIVFDTNDPIMTNAWLNTIGSAYPVSVTSGEGGDVLRVPWNATAFPGEAVTLTAVPDPGWVFSGWSGDLSGTTNPASLTVDGPVSVAASFAALSYTLDTAVIGDGSVAVAPDQETYQYNEAVLLAATPGTGYEFVQWDTGSATGTDNPWEIRIRGDTLVTATFTLPAYTLEVHIVGNGSVTKDPDLATYLPSTAVTVSATPDPGWSFVQWDTGAITSTVNPLEIQITADTVVTTTFEAEEYLLEVSVSGNGSVAVQPELATYAYGQVVTLTATADAGWFFAGWSGDTAGTTNPLEVTISANTAITASFEEALYTLELTVVGEGAVMVDPLQDTYAGGAVVTLTAIPDPGRTFRGWSGDASGHDNPLQVTISGDTSITASFWRCLFLPLVVR